MKFEPGNSQKRGINRGLAWVAVVNATLGMFLMGYMLSVINILQGYLTFVVFNWDTATATQNTSFLNSVATIGAGMGAFLGGNIAKSLGRRRSMILTDLISIVAVLMTLFANVPIMILGRLVAGLSVGLHSSLVPLYVQEIAPREIKGVAGSFIQLQCCIGSLVAYAFGFLLPTVSAEVQVEETSSWRLILGFPIVISLIRLFVLFNIVNFETPSYLLSVKRDEDAKRALAHFYTGSTIMEEYDTLKKASEGEIRQGPMKYSSLLRPQYRSRFLIACFVSLLQQFTGVNALIFYSTQIFQQSDSGDGGSSAVLLTTLFGVFNLLATIVSGQVIKRFGRKTILIWGDIAIASCLISIGILGYSEQYTAIKYFIMLYIIAFGLSYGPVLWIFVAEILPDIGVGVAILLNWIGAFAVAQFFQPFSEAVGMPSAFMCFGIYCLLSLVVIVWKVKETKDLNPHEIAQLYCPTVKSEEVSDAENEIKDSSPNKDEIMELIGPSI